MRKRKLVYKFAYRQVQFEKKRATLLETEKEKRRKKRMHAGRKSENINLTVAGARESNLIEMPMKREEEKFSKT